RLAAAGPGGAAEEHRVRRRVALAALGEVLPPERLHAVHHRDVGTGVVPVRVRPGPALLPQLGVVRGDRTGAAAVQDAAQAGAAAPAATEGVEQEHHQQPQDPQAAAPDRQPAAREAAEHAAGSLVGDLRRVELGAFVELHAPGRYAVPPTFRATARAASRAGP